MQVGSEMCRSTIRCYIDTISGSSLRPAVSAVSLADSTLLDPIELTQILRPHSLARSRSPSSSLPCSFTSFLRLLVLRCCLIAFIHSRMLVLLSLLSFPFFQVLSLVPSDRCYPFLSPTLFCPPFSLLSTDSSIHSFEHTLSRVLHPFFFCFLPFFFLPCPLSCHQLSSFPPFFYLVLFLATVFYFLRL